MTTHVRMRFTWVEDRAVNREENMGASVVNQINNTSLFGRMGLQRCSWLLLMIPFCRSQKFQKLKNPAFKIAQINSTNFLYQFLLSRKSRNCTELHLSLSALVQAVSLKEVCCPQWPILCSGTLWLLAGEVKPNS